MEKKEPLTRLRAQAHWPREAIRSFAFPQPPRAKQHLVARRRTENASGERSRKHISAPNIPASGDITATPDLLLPRRRFQARGKSLNPLFVYPPDGRSVFNDTSYPWRCCGRVTTNAGQGAGALVGPRHLLTASHVIGWTANDAGWLQFAPDYFDGEVFPSSWGQTVYSYEKISNADGEYDVAEDYVVVVLQDRLGDQLSWLGVTTYDDDWDGGSYWSHVGYPDDVGGGTRPAWEQWFSIANSWSPGFFESGSGLDIETYASLNHGDSGGPIFGWWGDGGPYGGNPAGPYIVAVVSSEGTLEPVITDPVNRTANWLAGGSEMPDLVNQARGDFP